MILTLEIAGEQAEDFGARGRKVFHAVGGTIGRLPDNDWVFPDPYVSGRHALIRYLAGQFFVEDTSTNGVYLNSPENRLQKSQPHALKHGDLLYIDAFKINVSIESEAGIGDERMDTLAMLKGANASRQAAVAAAKGAPKPAPASPAARASGPSASRPVTKPPPHDATAFLPAEDDHTIGLQASLDEHKTEWIGMPAAGTGVVNNDNDRTEWIGLPSAAAPRDDHQTQWLAPVSAPVPERDDNRTEWIGIPNTPAVDDNKTEWFTQKPTAEPAVDRPRVAPVKVPVPSQKISTGAPRSAATVLPPVTSAAAPAPRPAAAATPSVAASDGAIATGRERSSVRSVASAGGDDAMMREMLAAAGIVGVEPSLELAQTVGEILRIAVAGMMEVQRARERMKDELRVRGTIFKPAHNNPLKFSANVEDAFHNLLLKHNAAYLDPTHAFEDAFHDVRDHHTAILAALRLAFESMLAQFDPARMQDEFDRQMKKGSILGVPVKLRYWELYRDRYGNMVKDADTSFRHLFGDKFAFEYEEQLGRLKSQGRDREK